MKFILYYTKKCGWFLGIQLLIVFLGFFILMIPNDTALLIIGVVIVILNGFFFFLSGKSAALNDFKYKRINLAKFGGKTPYYEACKEMKLSKAAAIAGVFFVFNLILVIVGAFADSVAIRAIVAFEFMGIMLIGSGSGFLTAVNGIAAVEAVAADPENGVAAVEAVEGVAGKPGLFPALFLPLIFLICAAYVAGYALSMARRNKQHREIQDEIEMFNNMGR